MSEKPIAEYKIRHLKLDPPLRVSSGTPVGDVLNQMRARKQTVAVICRDNECIGIFTERDFLNKMFGASPDMHAAVDQFMSSHPRTVTVEDTVGRAISLMHENGFRNIPLVDHQGKCAGLVRIKNIIDFLAEIYPEEVLNLPPPAERFTDTDGA